MLDRILFFSLMHKIKVTLLHLLDVLRIVMYVIDVRTVKGAFGQQKNVCEILITDHRYSINQW